MKVGFTGTRKGMSGDQKEQLERVLGWFGEFAEVTEFHHGGANGADREADATAVSLGYGVTVHPCPGVVSDKTGPGANGRGRFNGHDVDWDDVLPPLARNRAIVAAVDVLVAAPATDEEARRSGTWATVRYARRAGLPIVMLSRGDR